MVVEVLDKIDRQRTLAYNVVGISLLLESHRVVVDGLEVALDRDHGRRHELLGDSHRDRADAAAEHEHAALIVAVKEVIEEVPMTRRDGERSAIVAAVLHVSQRLFDRWMQHLPEQVRVCE